MVEPLYARAVGEQLSVIRLPGSVLLTAAELAAGTKNVTAQRIATVLGLGPSGVTKRFQLKGVVFSVNATEGGGSTQEAILTWTSSGRSFVNDSENKAARIRPAREDPYTNTWFSVVANGATVAASPSIGMPAGASQANFPLFTILGDLDYVDVAVDYSGQYTA